MKTCISMLTLVTACLVHAQYTPVEELFYSIENNEVTITGRDLNTTRLSIPPTIEGFPVTRIANSAFSYAHDSITSVVLPASVTHIGNSAFRYGSGLQSIEMPGVTYIGDGAFTGCTSLTSVTLPDLLTTINTEAFYSCTALTSVTLPESLTSIGDRVFFDCTALTSVTLPDSLTTINLAAFENCTSLTSITLPASLSHLGSNAFNRCSALTSITFLGNAPSLGIGVFLSTPATAYIYEGATGFGDTFGGLSVVVLTTSAPLTLDSITVENGNLIIKPTDGTDGITIEQTDDLVEGTWTPLTPTIVDGCFQLPASGTADFYRLSH